ncbi:MAG: type II toxin-antitoxin system MqsA family antitoxin [Acidobacteriia bacterium]|jgi:YgiT-type zinc finger domain-containing protein|nr:type II toxin-antitoxin system MqsA family antitoxin [Terriglobia bacterium]
MRCIICRQADTQEGKATLTLERGTTTLVVKGVPARVCPNCGEEYVDEKVAEELLRNAETIAKAGVHVDVREYASA